MRHDNSRSAHGAEERDWDHEPGLVGLPGSGGLVVPPPPLSNVLTVPGFTGFSFFGSSFFILPPSKPDSAGRLIKALA